MKELSLNILDIAENSVKAGATLTEITVLETDSELTITIKDNGCGMDKEMLNAVTNPFYTTRTTRSVGLGIPLMKMAAEQTGGDLKIESVPKTIGSDCHGTTVTARFYKNHIDFTPLGDAAATLITLIQGHPGIDFVFTHNRGYANVSLDTRELRKVLLDVPLDTYEVLKWIEDNIREQYNDEF